MPVPDGLMLDLDPPCAYCKHFLEAGTSDTLKGWKCKAYPIEIPYGILVRGVKHDTELPGQLPGFLYESKDFGDGLTITFEGVWQDGSDESGQEQDGEAGA